jgi:plastocyanin
MNVSSPVRVRVLVGLLLVTAALVVPGAVTAASHEISIVDFGYEPAGLTVAVGDPVTWTNASGQDHTVTADEGAEFEGEPIRPGEAYGHVFETAGTYAYHCAIHPDRMTGTIVVVAAEVTPSPEGTPEPTPPAGTLPPNFSPFPSAGPVTSPPPATAIAPQPSATAEPGAPAGSDGGPQLLVLLFIGAALLGVVGYVLLRSRHPAA